MTASVEAKGVRMVIYRQSCNETPQRERCHTGPQVDPVKFISILYCDYKATTHKPTSAN